MLFIWKPDFNHDRWILVQVLYSTPDQSKSGSACHMTAVIQLLFKLGDRIEPGFL